MKLILPVFAMIGTVIATVTALVFCMAMGANATPEQLRTLKFWMATISLLGVGGVAAGLLLMRAGQPGWGAAAALAPMVIYGLMLGVALLR